MQLDRYTCEETFRRLDDYLDRELSVEEMASVKEHLNICAICAQEFAFEAEVLIRVKAKLRSIQAPTGLLEKMIQNLMLGGSPLNPESRDGIGAGCEPEAP